MNRKIIVAVVVLILIITLNSIIFDKLLNTSYIRWYINVGTLIGFASSFFGLVWDLDSTPDYISLNPFLYLATCFGMVSVSVFASSYPILISARSKNADERIKSINQEDGCLSSLINYFSYLIFTFILVLIFVGWLILIVPIQYFTFVICGAPARQFMRRKERVLANTKYGRLNVVIVNEKNKVIHAFDSHSKIIFQFDTFKFQNSEGDTGWWDAAPSKKPVTVTSLFSSVFFIVLGRVLDLVQTLS